MSINGKHSREDHQAEAGTAASGSTSLISFSSKISRQQIVAYVSVRFSGDSSFFADWMTRTAPMLARGDTVYLPFDGGCHAPISGLDQGRVIAALLKSPHQHAGQTFKLTGTADVTPAEMVDQLGQHIGRSLTFQPVPAVVFCDPIKQQTSRTFSDPADPGLAERLADIDYLAQHLGEVAKDYSAGSFSGIDTSVADITEIPAQTLAEFYSDNDAVFRASKPVGSAAS